MESKIIEESPNYSVYEDGRVMNNVTKKFRTPKNNGRGYLIVDLPIRPNVYKNFYIHRLVAKYFIGDIEGKDIEHNDGNKHNNHKDNLIIMDHKDNIRKGLKDGYLKKGKDGKFVKVSNEIYDDHIFYWGN